MMVPKYWAETKQHERKPKQSVTVRRFGWSDLSQEDAQRMANERATDALAKILAGEKLDRREPKVAYNGSDGIPIREEIVASHGDAVVTRNSYGALCLNTPNVLFADIDFSPRTNGRLMLSVAGLLLLLATAVGVLRHSVGFAIGLGVVSLLLIASLASALQRLWNFAHGGPEAVALKKLRGFVAQHTDWQLRLYKTPAGIRALALHRTFDPTEPAVFEFFMAVGADPIYARMCARQRCFRARVSAKPWRISIDSHMKPRPGVWPINPDRMADRQQWIDRYEIAASKYAACQFIERIGSYTLDTNADKVRVLHDDLSRATRSLAIA